MFTYLFHNKSDGSTKIGRSKSPVARIVALASYGHHVPVCVFSGDREKQLHRLHAKKRFVGEWFTLSAAELKSYRRHPENLLAGGATLSGEFPQSEKNNEDGSITLKIKLEPKFADMLIRLAKKEGRSASNQAKVMLEAKYAKP